MPPSSEKRRCKMTDNDRESSDHEEEEATADHTIRRAAGLVHLCAFGVHNMPSVKLMMV